MSPRPSRAAERRPQILAAAALVISERGLDQTRLSDVASEAGLSVGTIQHYFKTRERLLMEAFAFETERAVNRWLTAGRDGAGPWEHVLALVEIVLHPPTFQERWSRWLQFWAAYARDPKLRRAMGEVYDSWRAPFRRAIEEGVASGDFDPVMPVDLLVDRNVALFDGLALQVLLEAPGTSIERMRDLLVESLAHDLGVREAARLDRAQSAMMAGSGRGNA
jgi:AcrR family transcriptional regulator